MTIVLADLGGTHLRLAKAGSPSNVTKYKIADYPSIDSVLKEYAPDITGLYLAAAIQPRGRVIEDKRFGDKSHWTIHLDDLQKNLNLLRLVILNDLEAAAYAATHLTGEDLSTLLEAKEEQIHFDHPPKLVIGIGTGIGHAFLFEKAGHVPFVQRSHGGHIPAIAVSEEQKEIVSRLDQVNKRGRDLIIEDIVSGTGFANLKVLVSESNAHRLFWEFLGLYCNMLVSAGGAYGGVYLTGGVMNEMMSAGKVDNDALARNFLRPMVPVVIESLSSTPIYYCREENMPILGLSTLAKS